METNGAEPRADSTLTRVVESARRSSRRRMRLLKLWLPLAAVLVASTAWAAAHGHLDGLVRTAPVSDTTHPSAFAAAPSVDLARPLQIASARAEATAEPTSSATSTATTSATSTATTSAATTSATSTATTSAASSGPSALALDTAAYEAAYRVHAGSSAGGRAAEAAVVAWDRYLRNFPRGRFLPEARYARAVALARAGRAADAKRAMTPFAEGDGYRKADAERWIDSLERSAPAPAP